MGYRRKAKNVYKESSLKVEKTRERYEDMTY